MRIISGQFGGRTLKAPPSQAPFRPTTDRVRESLFNVLAHSVGFDGQRVIDLFAGTGALGLEALSRGAKEAVFVESNRRHAKIIQDNVEALGLKAQTTVAVMKVESFIKSPGSIFDIIFFDPPYGYEQTDGILETISSSGMLSEGGMCCVEHGGKETVSPPPGWRIVQVKQYGTTGITLLEPTGEENG